MKAYAIRDGSISKTRDLAWLLYYEREKAFHIEICEDVDEWDAPLILSSFVRREVRSLDPYWSRIWVEQRIVPRDRQNLGMILKENGLRDYDAHRLLLLSGGKCAQDDCFIAPLRKESLPAELCRRLGRTLLNMTSAQERTLFFFRDGLVESISDSLLQELPLQADCAPGAGFPDSGREQFVRRMRSYRDRLNELCLQPGGHGVTLCGECHVASETLRRYGTPLPVTAEDFKAYIQQELIDTAGAADMLDCTRQNIQDLVRRGKLKPLVTLRNNFLFLKNEIRNQSVNQGTVL